MSRVPINNHVLQHSGCTLQIQITCPLGSYRYLRVLHPSIFCSPPLISNQRWSLRNEQQTGRPSPTERSHTTDRHAHTGTQGQPINLLRKPTQAQGDQANGPACSRLAMLCYSNHGRELGDRNIRATDRKYVNN